MELNVGVLGALVSVNTMFVLTGPGLFPVSRARTLAKDPPPTLEITPWQKATCAPKDP